MNSNSDKRDILGVVGGLGPLASAEFLKTVYENYAGALEQQLPLVAMYSDPTFPDRSESFRAGSFDPLLARLADVLQRLCDLGSTRIVICCFTIHHLMPGLPGHLREKVWSLIEVALAAAIERRERQLLVCSNGSRDMKVFESHGLWGAAKEFVVFPDERDQQLIHKMIYEIKSNHDVGELVGPFKSILANYSTDSFISGCTEIHLLAKRLAVDGGVRCIDPLTIIAKRLMPRSANAPAESGPGSKIGDQR
jgi:aspartate racemase